MSVFVLHIFGLLACTVVMETDNAVITVDDVDWSVPSMTAVHRLTDHVYHFAKNVLTVIADELQLHEEGVAVIASAVANRIGEEEDDDDVDGNSRKRPRTTAPLVDRRQLLRQVVTRSVAFGHRDDVDSGMVAGPSSTTASTSGTITLCDKSIILFAGEPNERVRTDVTNCLILAQLNADKQLLAYKTNVSAPHSVIECLKEWFRVFQQTFLHMNWVDTGFQVDEAEVKGDTLSVDKVLLEVIEAIGSEEEKGRMHKAMQVLKSLPETDERLSLFKRRTVQRDMTQFLVQMVTIDKRGSATIKSTMIGLSTKMDVTNVLWFQWSDTETRVFKTEHTMMLGSKTFEGLRPVIESKIQKINETYVNQIAF